MAQLARAHRPYRPALRVGPGVRVLGVAGWIFHLWPEVRLALNASASRRHCIQVRARSIQASRSLESHRSSAFCGSRRGTGADEAASTSMVVPSSPDERHRTRGTRYALRGICCINSTRCIQYHTTGLALHCERHLTWMRFCKPETPPGQECAQRDSQLASTADSGIPLPRQTPTRRRMQPCVWHGIISPPVLCRAPSSRHSPRGLGWTSR
jgi:hypothetical protein